MHKETQKQSSRCNCKYWFGLAHVTPHPIDGTSRRIRRVSSLNYLLNTTKTTGLVADGHLASGVCLSGKSSALKKIRKKEKKQQISIPLFFSCGVCLGLSASGRNSSLFVFRVRACVRVRRNETRRDETRRDVFLQGAFIFSTSFEIPMQETAPVRKKAVRLEMTSEFRIMNTEINSVRYYECNTMKRFTLT